MTNTALSSRLSIICIAGIMGVTACSGDDEDFLVVNDDTGVETNDLLEEYGTLPQALTTYGVLPTSGTSTFTITSNPGDDNILILNSPSSGNWRFRIYGSPVGWDGCYTGDHVVFTYWKNGGGAWNYWPGGGGICWPTSFWTTNLYSGSSSISYKFEVENYTGFPETPYGQSVHLEFTKL